MTRLVITALVIAACSRSEPAKESEPGASAQAAAPKGHHEDRNEPAIATPPLKLEVQVDGAATTWAQDVFDRVAHTKVKNNSGQERDTWSLRDLAHEMVGETARVVAVIGAKKETITPEAWTDASRTPILHRTRRGALKFRWADANGAWGEATVEDVVGLEIVR